MIGKLVRVVAAIVLGVSHVVFADILFFYGTVINPEFTHKVLNTVAFILTLPFSAFLFVPGIEQVFILAQVAIIGFWIITYYWLIRKGKSICRSCKLTYSFK